MSLTKKYRPRTLEQVLGQDAIVKSFGKLLERKSSHAFLFSGPSGCGKTTLARIGAKMLGCEGTSRMDIDGATFTGIDAMRTVKENVQYRPLGGDNYSVIIDEAHMLSKSAWNSLLTIVEEPPSHVYWFFCTTEVGKVPQTIKTRCSSFTLKPVDDVVLETLFQKVIKKENLVDLPIDVGRLVVREAHGSPRQMLTNLDLCREATNKKEAAKLLESALETDAVIDLCKFLLRPGSWLKAMDIVGQIDAPESCRIIVMNYMGKVAASAKSNDEAERICTILEAFATPYNPSEGKTPLILSVGRILLG